MIYDQIAANTRRTWALVVLFVVFVTGLGYLFGELTDLGYAGAAIGLVIALASAWASYYYSDGLVLAMSGAHEADRDRYRFLYNTVEGLAIAAGVPAPRVYVIDDSAPNAFATGRDPQHAVVVVTTGLLEKLDRLEVEGVVAHELAHIRNYDVRVMTLAAVMVGTVVLLSDWLLRSLWWGGGGRRRGGRDGGGAAAILALVGVVAAVLAPLVAQLLHLALSRNREYLADASGALLTRYPEGLASALAKIATDREPLEAANRATAHLYIENPLRERRGWLDGLFNTHPPIDERIRRLRGMASLPPQGLEGLPGRA